MTHSLLTGLCPLIPLPLLDDWVLGLVRRRQVRVLMRERQLELADDEIEVLASGYSPVTASGCFTGCVKTAFVAPVRFVFQKILRKLLRKFLVIFMVKDCVDAFSATFHEAYLLRHALLRGALGEPDAGGPPRFQRTVDLRRAIEEVRDEVDHRPVERWARQAFGASRRLFSTTARSIARGMRALGRGGRRDEDRAFEQVTSDSAPLEELIDELTEEIGHETSYLAGLGQRLDRRLRTPSTAPSVAENPHPNPDRATP
ncbi:MAG: hypothetical protein AAGD06_12465 [Acidobacteriota bacterium]